MSEGHPKWKCHPIIQYFTECFPWATCIGIMCRTLKILRFQCSAVAPGPQEGGSPEEQPWNVHVLQTALRVLKHIKVWGSVGISEGPTWRDAVCHGDDTRRHSKSGVFSFLSCARSCRVNVLANAKCSELWRLLNGETHGFASGEHLMFQLHLQ